MLKHSVCRFWLHSVKWNTFSSLFSRQPSLHLILKFLENWHSVLPFFSARKERNPRGPSRSPLSWVPSPTDALAENALGSEGKLHGMRLRKEKKTCSPAYSEQVNTRRQWKWQITLDVREVERKDWWIDCFSFFRLIPPIHSQCAKGKKKQEKKGKAEFLLWSPFPSPSQWKCWARSKGSQ